MTITATPPQQRSVPQPQKLTTGRLPAMAVWAILGGSLAAMLVVFLIMSVGSGEGLNFAGWLVTSVDLASFDRVTLTGPDGQPLAAGEIGEL